MNKQIIEDTVFMILMGLFLYAFMWLSMDGYYPDGFVQEPAWTQEEINQYWQP